MYIILLILDNILKLRNASKILSINLNFVRQFLFRYLIKNWYIYILIIWVFLMEFFNL